MSGVFGFEGFAEFSALAGEVEDMNGAARPFGGDDQRGALGEMVDDVFVVEGIVAGRVITPHADGFAVLRRDDFVPGVIHEVRALGASDLQHGGFWVEVDRGDAEVDEGAVGEADDGGSFVFVGVVFVGGEGSPDAARGEAGHFGNFRINKLETVFEKMDTPVVEDAARDFLT